MIDGLLALVAPHHCSGCHEIGTLLCDNCKYDISSEWSERCIQCLAPSPTGICSHHRAAYKKAWFVGERKDTLQHLIGGLKFQNTKAAAKHLADLLNDHLPDLPADTIIIPIPTAASHIRERGYDHMLLIAQHLAQKRNLQMDNRLLIRKNV